jgi:hypothetical protein
MSQIIQDMNVENGENIQATVNFNITGTDPNINSFCVQSRNYSATEVYDPQTQIDISLKLTQISFGSYEFLISLTKRNDKQENWTKKIIVSKNEHQQFTPFDGITLDADISGFKN